ncbi:hypothetical protein TNCV_1212301 [Trichonephila clavipes]|nr:hypothetical protein TNCV_1212301 [Trichonephila clavipes]
MCKRSDLPEFTRQAALETIHDIPHLALKIYTDGSMGDGGISRSGVHIETPDDELEQDYDSSKRCKNGCQISDFITLGDKFGKNNRAKEPSRTHWETLLEIFNRLYRGRWWSSEVSRAHNLLVRCLQ